MKKTLSLLALLLVSLAVTSTLSAQVNIQKTQGTNAVSNGNIVIGTGTTLSTSGTGAITATAFSGSGTVAVANGGTGSTTATAAQRALTPATSTVTTGASPAVNWSLSNSFDLTLTSATAATVSFSNAQDGQVITIAIHQPASGTATTVTWPTMKWSGGTAPTMTATLGKTDVFTIYYNATASAYYGSAVQNF